MNLKDIVLNIINIFEEKQLGFGKTRIIKIAYLLEIWYYEKYRKNLTDAKWIFYKYGPYPINYTDYLEHDNILISDDDKNFKSIKLIDKKIIPEIPIEIKLILDSLIIEYGDLNLNKLLNYVYFETEPMVHAIPNQQLNFEFISSEIPKKILISVNNKNKKKLKEIRKRMSNNLEKIQKNNLIHNVISEDIFKDSDILL